MKDELHRLLDGDLPDRESAELFRQLAEDAGERIEFRRQMQLQGALYRNNCFDGMTPLEEAELYDTVAGDIKAPPLRPSGFGFARVAAIAAAVLLLGGGAGYVAHALIAPERDAVVVQPVAPVFLDLPMSIAERDALVAQLRDSLQEEIAPAPANTTRKGVTRRKPVRRKKFNAVTGE